MFEGPINARDLGGIPGIGGRRLRHGVLFRSAELYTLTENDHETLRRLGVRVIYDMRSGVERKARPARLWDGHDIALVAHDYGHGSGDLTRIIANPAVDVTAVETTMLSHYEEFPDRLAEVFRGIFSHVAEGRLPMIFHCAAGKDRTGAAAALLLSALGVAWRDIEADYVLTERCFDENFARFLSYGRRDGVSDEVWKPIMRADPAYLRRMFAAIERRHGDVYTYLDEVLGVDAIMVEQVRDRLLEPGVV